jgi:hypothetical protein
MLSFHDIKTNVIKLTSINRMYRFASCLHLQPFGLGIRFGTKTVFIGTVPSSFINRLALDRGLNSEQTPLSVRRYRESPKQTANMAIGLHLTTAYRRH